MLAVYDSLTGMGKRVAQKLEIDYVDINEFTDTDQPILLLTRSFNFGEVTEQAEKFLQQHAHKVVGVAVSGNRNWGENFGAAGEKISKRFGIPLVRKYEGTGFPEDIEQIKNWINEYHKNH